MQAISSYGQDAMANPECFGHVFGLGGTILVIFVFEVKKLVDVRHAVHKSAWYE
jgi:hypothetical protein